jgi:HAD superfamily hydrolase (TIGR01509 family)
MHTLKAVIFDMDGVLIDSHPVHKKAWTRFLASVGKMVTDEELEFVLDGRRREDILSHFLGALTPAQTAEYGRHKEQLFREAASEVSTVLGVGQFIDELQRCGIPMAVASCGSSSRVHFILQRLGLEHRFSAVVTADDVQVGKPDPAIFQKAASAIGAPPECSVVVEDAVSGVIAAKAAGMKCLAIASNGRGKALHVAGADSVVSDFLTVHVPGLMKLFH